MRVIIVGGNGFIGKNAVEFFSKKGLEVVSCDISYPTTEISGVSYHKILDIAQYDSVLRKGDAVIYLPCRNVPATSNNSMSFGINENILEAVNFFEKCGSLGISRIVYSSSGGAVYGDMHDTRPLSEKDIPKPISVYGIQKLTIENYLTIICKKYDMIPIILRIANPYGRWQKPFRGQGIIPTFLASALIDINQQIEIWGNGEETRDYIYIDDLMEAMKKSLNYSGDERVFNVGGGNPYSINDIIRMVEKEVGKKYTEKVYKREYISEVKNNYLDCSLIKRELNWEPQISLEKGIHMLRGMWHEDTKDFY